MYFLNKLMIEHWLNVHGYSVGYSYIFHLLLPKNLHNPYYLILNVNIKKKIRKLDSFRDYFLRISTIHLLYAQLMKSPLPTVGIY